eukprot:TRINITY_DN7784_c0_g1_i1.p1 TRINITY_DN7784_c0_g1~~TRINITY_DN7784_c0_g1_i1.p1  ORF type:complete len:166 (-),score=32.09 TRINITY_DN7784_c0_g1_i1:6-503(-)
MQQDSSPFSLKRSDISASEDPNSFTPYTRKKRRVQYSEAPIPTPLLIQNQPTQDNEVLPSETWKKYNGQPQSHSTQDPNLQLIREKLSRKNLPEKNVRPGGIFKGGVTKPNINREANNKLKASFTTSRSSSGLTPAQIRKAEEQCMKQMAGRLNSTKNNLKKNKR